MNVNHQESLQLSSLAQWSYDHINAVFESATDDESIHAIEATFTKDVEAMVNGKRSGLPEIKHMVLMMRKECPNGLKVQWLPHTVQVPSDPSNRGGSFGGMYTIHGIERIMPGNDKPAKFARHKAVTVRIESQSVDQPYDSRRIVALVFVASDIQIPRDE